MFRSAPNLQKLQTLDNVEGLLHLLKQHGCTEVEIARIMRYQPQLMLFADKVLEPKIKLLEDFGFVDRNLARLLSKYPSILKYSLKTQLPKMKFLKNVFQSEDVLVKALLRYPRILNNCLETILKPSLAFWEGWGFCGAALVSFLQVNPAVLSRTSLTPARVDLIHKIAADKQGKLYKYIVSAVTLSRIETLEAKVENFKLLGLSTEEICHILGAVPQVILCSEENVTEKMNLLFNKMELTVNDVVKHPNLLQISLEKTMRPRGLVLQKIRSIDDADLPVVNILMMTEARFIRRIIKGHPESETLLKTYENAVSNAPAPNRIKRSKIHF